jgi:dolichol-phosphate mannosyltransferase
MNILAIIPTYNERENVARLLPAILALRLAHPLSVLVVDDNSPDGTASVVARLMEEQTAAARLFLLSRPRKEGIAAAYLAGFRWCLERGFDLLIQMDADMSHDPCTLPALIAAAERFDFVIGSRYAPGGSVQNWGIWRRMLSRGGSLFARAVLHSGISDLTGGFNAWRRGVFKRVDLSKIISRGYCFQIELKYRATLEHLSWTEVPIVFRDRIYGASKMTVRIALEALRNVLLLPHLVHHG